MSMTQTILGSSVLILVGTTVVDLVTPSAPNIVVHALHYEAGVMHQDRTVIPNDGSEVFYAFWAAQIIDANTGAQVCSGDGSWPYAGGRKVVALPLDEWVGSDCDLGPGEYVPLAAWYWGSDQTSFTGQPFTIE